MHDNMNVQRRLMFVSPQLELASFQLSGAYNVKLLNPCFTKCEPTCENTPRN
jgi:hypothetical protein